MEAQRIYKDLYTYADYVKWPDDERWEIIEGRAYAMTPSPTIRHQDVQVALIRQLGDFFEGKTCRVLASPLDVILSQANESDEMAQNVFQPDVLVVCDPAKLAGKFVRGAPDLVIEILSESTTERDMGIKLRLYEKYGVRCYIIADPWGKTMTVRYRQPEGTYGDPEIYAGNRQMPIRIFDGLALELPRVFAD